MLYDEECSQCTDEIMKIGVESRPNTMEVAIMFQQIELHALGVYLSMQNTIRLSVLPQICT